MTKTKQKIIWEPLPGSQQLFLSCPYFEVLYEGTRGGGKTDCLLMDFGQHVGQGYGAAWKGILFRQTYKQLTDVISKTRKWFPQIWPQAKFNASEHYWIWPTGEQLLLRQFQREDDYWNYHGHEYPWLGWEELCNWPSPAGYLRMISTCRSTTRGMPRKLRATTNPYGPGHNWVKRRFRLMGMRNRPIKDDLDEFGNPLPTRIAIFSDIRENTILEEIDPQYLNRLMASAKSEAERRAWTEGSWDIVSGGMFDDVFDQKHNIVEPFDIPSSWYIDRAFDWGSAKPFSVGWWAKSDGSDYRDREGKWHSTVRGDLFRIAEWYGCEAGESNVGLKMTNTNITKGIIERELEMGLYGRVNNGVADSAIFNYENGSSIATDMGQPVRIDGREYPGIGWLPADKRPGSRITGWNQCRKMMEQAHPPETGVREHPGLFVFSTCYDFLNTVPVLSRLKNNPEDIDKDSEDHIADEMRYKVRDSQVVSGSGGTVGMY